MFDINVLKEQVEFAQELLKTHNFGNRGYGDGNYKEQLTGIIGQTVLADLLSQPRPSGEKGFDEGIDFIINGKKVDVKTMTRAVPMRDYFVHNFIGYQLKYDTEYYIFQSYNVTLQIITICGYVSKVEFLQRANFFKKGVLRQRSNGTSFSTKAPFYEIEQTRLNELEKVKDIFDKIK